MFDNPRQKLDWLEEELLDDELEEILYGDEDTDTGRTAEFHRAVYADEDDDEERYVLLPKRKGIKGLVFLAVLEILGILAILGWWLQWLI